MESSLDRTLARARGLCVEAIAELQLLDRNDYREWERLAATMQDVQNALAGAHVRSSKQPPPPVGTSDDELLAALAELDGLLREAAVSSRRATLMGERDPDHYEPPGEAASDAYALAERIDEAFMSRRKTALNA